MTPIHNATSTNAIQNRIDPLPEQPKLSPAVSDTPATGALPAGSGGSRHPLSLNRTKSLAPGLTNDPQSPSISETKAKIFAEKYWHCQVFNKPMFSCVPIQERPVGASAQEELAFLFSKKGLQDRVQILTIAASDNSTLTAVYTPAKGDAPTIVHAAGLGASIERSLQRLQDWSDRGFGFATYIPLGCESPTAKRSEEKLYESMNAVSDYLTDEKNVPSEKQVVWGHSWGTAAAVQCASKKQIPLIVESGSPSVEQEHLAKAKDQSEENLNAVKEKYADIMDVSKLPAPPQTLILHSKEDGWTDFKCASAFKNLYGDKARIVPFEGSAHNIGLDAKVAADDDNTHALDADLNCESVVTKFLQDLKPVAVTTSSTESIRPNV